MNYAPLNILSGYTFLESSLRVDDIFSICDKYQYPYFSICDLNVMYSYSDIENVKDKYKAKPIYGASFKYQLNQNDMITVNAYIINETGYRNLIKIISLYNKGINKDQLNSLKEGLIIIVPILSNQCLTISLKEDNLSNFARDLFYLFNGFNDSYFGIEIYSKDDYHYAEIIRDFAKNHNYKTIAFNKHLYLEKSDAISLKLLNAIKNDLKLEDKNSEGPYFFLKYPALSKLYTKNELDNTIVLAKQCSQFVFISKRGTLLNYPLKENKRTYIYNKCLSKLNILNLTDEKYIERLNYELNIIENMGYLDYFLIVSDYVNYCKDNNIPVGPGRGSAAGSLVSYLLNITEVDSLKYDLLFERFLNPKRTSMPDIDVDFADYRRDDVVKYIINKYSNQKCANIITFQTFGPRAALRDVGKVFNIDNRDINTISNLIGKATSFKQAYKNNPSFKELLNDSYFLDIVKLARKIEGLPRQAGMHAAGIIIDNNPLHESLPIINNNDLIVSQFEAPLLEKLGYLKMDILGLTNLSIIESMTNYIKEYYDSNFNIENISLNDQKTFDVLNKGLTCGIFQLESGGITKSLKEVIINSFDDLVAILALYRPGPMDNIPTYSINKNEHRKITYLHPILETILKPTYGVIVYQEQIMQIVQLFAGFDLGKADLFRRAISKKDSTKLAALKQDFINGALKNNIDEKTSNEVFALIYKFADYGFNKSHSVSYAIISYQMAYIKANYPTCYYASLLNHLSLNDSRILSIRQELNYFNITLSLPDINKSKLKFVIENNKLIIPFTLIRGLNRQALLLINEMQKNKINSFKDFVALAHEYSLNNDHIISLINSGCFDSFNHTRQTLRSSLYLYRQYYENISSEGLLTQEELSLYAPLIEEEEEENNHLKYDLEFQTLGILLSGSLLEKHQSYIEKNKIKTIQENAKYLNKNVAIVAFINKIKLIKTKKKESMAIVYLQDDSMELEAILFPNSYSQYMYLLKENSIARFDGVFTIRDENLSFIINKITPVEEK